jgi:hypothetical protein
VPLHQLRAQVLAVLLRGVKRGRGAGGAARLSASRVARGESWRAVHAARARLHSRERLAVLLDGPLRRLVVRLAVVLCAAAERLWPASATAARARARVRNT